MLDFSKIVLDNIKDNIKNEMVFIFSKGKSINLVELTGACR